MVERTIFSRREALAAGSALAFLLAGNRAVFAAEGNAASQIWRMEERRRFVLL
jgi:uncharacterized BrkB/YihY/UPF0761 family membrane protein